MYETSFFQAKNGSETCKINQTLLHSAYNPELEAERFASSIEADFIPSAVFVIEPALSYCGKPLKKKFPGTEIYSVRFSKDFIGYGKDFSKSFFLKPKIRPDLKTRYTDSSMTKHSAPPFFLNGRLQQKSSSLKQNRF